jgi:hypothetical protein
MAQRQEYRTGVLMARVWVEDGSDLGWRCRITRTADIAQVAEVSSVVSTPEQVFNAVREWLDRCEHAAAARPGGRSNE